MDTYEDMSGTKMTRRGSDTPPREPYQNVDLIGRAFTVSKIPGEITE